MTQNNTAHSAARRPRRSDYNTSSSGYVHYSHANAEWEARKAMGDAAYEAAAAKVAEANAAADAKLIEAAAGCCAKCDGAGFVEDDDCDACDGTGGW